MAKQQRTKSTLTPLKVSRLVLMTAGTGLTTVSWSGTGTLGTVAVVDPSDGSTFIANSSSGSTHTFIGSFRADAAYRLTV